MRLFAEPDPARGDHSSLLPGSHQGRAQPYTETAVDLSGFETFTRPPIRRRRVPTVPDASTRSSRKYPVRNTYSLETWMDDAIITAALNHGVTQADVVRECLEYGCTASG